MINSLVLIKEKEGHNLDKDTLMGAPQMNAKAVVVGWATGFGAILHVAANSPADLKNALLDLAAVEGVAEVSILKITT